MSPMSTFSARFGLTLKHLGAAAAITAIAAFVTPADAANNFGSGKVRTMLAPTPGFPEGIVVDHNRFFVSGPATFGTAGQGPSTIGMYNRKTGQSLGTIAVEGEATDFEHALSCITTDGDGRVYVLSTQLGVVRFTEDHDGSWVQDIYAPAFPMLPSCFEAEPGTPCSPKWVSQLPPIPNDIAFDKDGFAYVTDSFQATIFRVPPGGGEAEIWFQSPSIVSFPGEIGVNGIRMSPNGDDIYFTVTSTAAMGGAGVVFKLPLVDAPVESDLEIFHTYAPGESPDGIAFGQHKDLYVTLAGSNQISVLSRFGTETQRISGPTGSAVPFDGPANIAFDREGSLLVTNHAPFTRDASHFAVLDVFVGDKGHKLEKP